VIQVTPHMRILVAVQPADFRKGIDGLAQLCRERLAEDPFTGTVFVFRNRQATMLRVLCHDGMGFWLCQKRLASGRFRFWPTDGEHGKKTLEAHQVQLLISGGDPTAGGAPPPWRRLKATG
jgi:transposase